MRAIHLLALGPVAGVMLKELARELESRLPFAVAIGHAHPRPDFAFNSARRQYFGDAILASMQSIPLAKGDKALGIFDGDTHTTYLRFVFGLADPEAGVALVALHRLHPEFYGQPPDSDLLLERTTKEAVHELGHTLGLEHCPDPCCVMYFSRSLADTDRKGADLCPRCAATL